MNLEDFLSQALRYYKHCDLNPRAYEQETRLSEIMQHLDNKYGKFLKRNNLLQFTANENWLDEALKIFAEGLICLEYYSDHATPANETPEDKRLTQLKWTIDSELEALTGVRNPPPCEFRITYILSCYNRALFLAPKTLRLHRTIFTPLHSPA